MSHVVEHWGVALTLTTILFSTGEETGSSERFDFSALKKAPTKEERVLTLVSHIAITVDTADYKFPFCGFELLLSYGSKPFFPPSDKRNYYGRGLHSFLKKKRKAMNKYF